MTASSAPKRVSSGPGWLQRQVQDHVRALTGTFGDLLRRPVATALTAFVIGITLALPAGLHALVGNLGRAGEGLQGSLRATLFLKDSTTADRGADLTREIASRPGVTAAHYISREEALQEFRAGSGFAAALDQLKENPLPAVIEVTPDGHQPQARIESLLKTLGELPEVEQARLDEKWVQRLYAILELVQKAVNLIAGALGVAVLVVVGNTIRLDIENHRHEIAVMKLIGAADGYIRRPYLYCGLWYGLAGAILACLLVEAGILALQEPAGRLAGLYGSPARLDGLGFDTALALFGIGPALGWVGAFWAVSRHLQDIEPA